MATRPKSAHKYNVQEQQDIYKEEVARIWKQQWDSLTNPVEPLLTQEDEDRQRQNAKAKKIASTNANTPASAMGTPAAGGDRAGTPDSRAESPGLDDGASVVSAKNGGKAKTLRIRRLVQGKWETEIVRDPSVIKAYVHQRSVIDEENLQADELLPSDDEGKNERRRKRSVVSFLALPVFASSLLTRPCFWKFRLKEQLEKLKRNQERRLARKNQKLGIAPGQIGIGGKKVGKTETVSCPCPPSSTCS